MAEYIDVYEAEKELISQCDSLFKLVNEKVKPEDCFIVRNEAYHQKLFRAEVKNFIEFLRARATADVQEVRHGEWKQCFEDWRKQIEGDKCSVCGFEYYGTSIRHYHYCPECGAKMDKEREKND